MANNPKFLKNIFATSALTVALVAASGNALGETRTTDADAILSTGAGLSQIEGAIAPFTAGGDLLLGGAHNINADMVDILIKQLNLAANDGQTFTVTENATLGSVFGDADEVMNFEVAAGKALLLNGDASAAANLNQYKGFGDVNLAAAGATLTIKATAPITLTGKFANIANSVINVQSDVTSAGTGANSILGNGGGAGGGTVNIGTAAAAATLTSKPTAANVMIHNKTVFLNADSKLVLDSSSAGAAAAWELTTNVGGNALGMGILELNANGRDITITGASNFGGSAATALKKVIVSGANAVIVEPNVFTQNIQDNNTKAITWTAALDLTDGGKYTVGANVDKTLGFTNGFTKGSIDADALDNTKTLTINGVLGVIGAPPAGAVFKTVSAVNARAVNLTANANIETLSFSGTLGLGDLGGATQYKIAAALHDDNKGGVSVNGDTTILTGSVLSAADNKLDNVKFVGNHTLTLGGGVNLYTANGFLNNALGEGAITTTGNVALGGKIGVNNKFGNITANAAAVATLQILDDINSQGNITANVDNTIQIYGNVEAAMISGAGTIETLNTAPVNINVAIGTGIAQVAIVKISGGDVETPSIFTPILQFGDKPATVTLTDIIAGDAFAEGNANTVITTTSIARNQNLAFAGDVVFGNTVGTEANPFGNMIMTTDSTTTISKANFFAGVTTTTDGKGTVLLNVADAKLLNAGAPDKALKLVTVRHKNTINNAYAKKFEIAAGVPATFSGAVGGGSIELQPGAAADGTEAIFTDGVQLVSAVSTNLDGAGKVRFLGGSTIKADIGSANPPNLESVTFDDNSGKTQSLQANIHSPVTFAKTRVSIDKEQVTFNKTVQANDTIFQLNNNQMVVNNVATLTGAPEISTTFNGETIGTFLVQGPNASIKADGVTALKVTLIDSSKTLTTKEIVLPLLKFSNGAVVADTKIPAGNKITAILPDSGGFVNWTFDKESFAFIGTYNGMKAAADIVSAQGGSDSAKEAAKALFNVNNTGEAANRRNELFSISRVDQKTYVSELEKFSSTPNNTDVLNNFNQEATNTIVSRATSIMAGSITGTPDANLITAAAGDEQKYSRYGAWGSPFYNHSTQKRKGSLSGYKAKSGGGTFGFDTMANDTMTIGVAATFARTNVTHKDKLAGDKTKINSYLFSIYGTQLIMDDYFVTGIATFGSSKVKNTSARKGFNNTSGTIINETAKANYDAMSWGGELLGGYHYRAIENMLVIPTIGVSYNQFNESGYTEKGTKFNNRMINKKTNRKIEAIAGLKVVGGMEMGGIAYTPEVHAYLRQALSNKAPKTEIRLNGMVEALSPKAAKASKTSGNIGTSVTVQSGILDYSLGYDLSLAKKYVGHQGTLKVRVNF